MMNQFLLRNLRQQQGDLNWVIESSSCNGEKPRNHPLTSTGLDYSNAENMSFNLDHEPHTRSYISPNNWVLLANNSIYNNSRTYYNPSLNNTMNTYSSLIEQQQPQSSLGGLVSFEQQIQGVGRAYGDSYCGRIGLDLGGRTYFSTADDLLSVRLGKRPRPSSPAAPVPMCQAQGCRADLSTAKHYHRRHKVCEMHSKASTVTNVNGQTQRFCQQCSRFQALSEFDEGKRSCRKRLADHNRRRRKPQPNAAPATDESTSPAKESTEADNTKPEKKNSSSSSSRESDGYVRSEIDTPAPSQS